MLDSRSMRRIAIAYAVFVVAVIALADVRGTHASFGLITRLPHGDKLGHFVLMGLLALFADLAAGQRDLGRVPLAPAVVAGLVSLEELSQLWLPGLRSFDLLDLAADALGIASAVWLGRRLAPVSRVST